MVSKRSRYRKFHKLKFADEEIYDEIVGIINIDSFQKHSKNATDYRKTLSECLKMYYEIITDTINDDDIVKDIGSKCHKIKDIVASCYKGLHNQAYTKTQNLLSTYEDTLFCIIPNNTEFYRMRVTDKRKGLSRSDIFHIPLNLRRCIKPQRFSTPGYPCLYLGKSLYVCWEEMNMPSTETTLVAGLKNTQQLKAADLRVPDLSTFLHHSEKFARLFPLIIASSIPVVNRDDVFKPEYLLPQLILEWTINKRIETSVVGVYYTSVFKNTAFFSNLDYEWDNIAIPVQNPLAKVPFCPKLTEMFILTKPTCYEYEHALGNIDNTGLWDSGPKRLETGDDKKREYHISQFSRMEELSLRRKYDNVYATEPE